MKLNTLSIAIFISTLPLTSVIAGGLDRSGQSISAFLQPGNYAEAGISVLDPDVKSDQLNVDDMAEDYYFPSTAVKVQATDKISVGLLYDHPFGADAQYSKDSFIFGDQIEGTSVEVNTQNITALIGYQPNKNWNIYAGPVYQTVEADIKLRGAAYGGKAALGTYNIKVDEEPAFGWIAGFAYQIPEIALKAAVTYRSEIKHDADSHETATPLVTLPPVLGGGTIPVPFSLNGKTEAITPQSVNLDLQTGISQNTLAFANVRWVHWDNFVVTPPLLAQLSQQARGKAQNLIDYSDDQWSATVGLGHKFTNKWSGTAAVGYDSGAGNPVTTLGPTEGYWSVGLGGQYSPAANYFIQAGVKYFWLGDATAQTGGTPVGEFEDNTAIGYGMKIGYRF